MSQPTADSALSDCPLPHPIEFQLWALSSFVQFCKDLSTGGHKPEGLRAAALCAIGGRSRSLLRLGGNGEGSKKSRTVG